MWKKSFRLHWLQLATLTEMRKLEGKLFSWLVHEVFTISMMNSTSNLRSTH